MKKGVIQSKPHKPNENTPQSLEIGGINTNGNWDMFKRNKLKDRR